MLKRNQISTSVKNLPPLVKQPPQNQILLDRSPFKHTTTEVRTRQSHTQMQRDQFKHQSPYSEVKSVNIQKFMNERDPIIKRFRKLKNVNVLPLSKSIDKINYLADNAILDLKHEKIKKGEIRLETSPSKSPDQPEQSDSLIDKSKVIFKIKKLSSQN